MPPTRQSELLLEADPAAAAAARRARREHERVAEQAPDGMRVRWRDRGRDEAVRRALEQRDLRQRLGAQRVRILVAPVLVDQRAAAQIADAGAAAAQEAGERARLGREVQRGAQRVHGLLERCAHVRRAERDPCADERVHSPPRWQALRATSPPIEWPTSAIRSTSTGQSATSSSSSAASDAPFAEMWRPVL